MRRRNRARTGAATAATAMLAVATVGVAPVAAPTPPFATRDVALTATMVPPGGLITSFVGNQFLYCSIICPLLVETAVTAGVTTVQTPFAFLRAVQSGDLLKALGAAAASVTGPTNAAAQAAILADGTLVAPRALNALEVGVVGRLDILAAVPDGLPGIVDAIRTARADTYTALHAPVVPNPGPIATPEGVLQVAVVAAVNVGAAIVFPAFNEMLSAVFDVPDAIARELAATGNPVRAGAAGLRTAAGHARAAVSVVSESVVTGLANIRAAVDQARSTRTTGTPDRRMPGADPAAKRSGPVDPIRTRAPRENRAERRTADRAAAPRDSRHQPSGRSMAGRHGHTGQRGR